VANDYTTRLLVRIRTLREAQSLSQEAFAERAGLKYKHYQAIEAGRKPKFQLPTLIKIAEALGLEPWQLLKFEVEPLILANEQVKHGSKAAPAKSAKRRSAAKRA
jgi:transcriptional regulator with XRE-family HTH domain